MSSDGRAPASRTRRWRGRLAALVLGIVMPLALAEGLFHLWPQLLPASLHAVAHRTPGRQFALHPDLTAVNRPDFDDWEQTSAEIRYRIRTRRLLDEDVGFRDDGIDGETWAVAIGDSFTFGTGLQDDETWPEVLESLLGKDVVNLGVSGHSAQQHAATLRTYGVKFEPEVVLVALFPNDHEDNVRMLGNKGRRARRNAATERAHRLASPPNPLDGPDWRFEAEVAPLPQVQIKQTPSGGVLESWQAAEPVSLHLRFRRVDSTANRVCLYHEQDGDHSLCLSVEGDDVVAALRESDRVFRVSGGRDLDEEDERTWHDLLLTLQDRSLSLRLDGDPPQVRRTGLELALAPAAVCAAAGAGAEVSPPTVFAGALDAPEWASLRQGPETTAGPVGTLFRFKPAGLRLWLTDQRRLRLARLGVAGRDSWTANRRVPGDGPRRVAVSLVDGRTLRFEIEGQPAGEFDVEWGASRPAEGSLILGGGSAQDGFRGMLRDVSLTGSGGELFGHWGLDPAGDPVVDQSGHGNVGRPFAGIGCDSGPSGMGFSGGMGILISDRESLHSRDQRPAVFYLRELWRLVRRDGPYAMALTDPEGFLPSTSAAGTVWLSREVMEGAWFHPEVIQGLHEGLPMTLAALTDLHQTCRRMGARLVILDVPCKELVYSPWLEDPATRPAEGPLWHQAIVRAHCEALGVPVIDPTEALRQAIADGGQPFFVVDAHWNAVGARIAAEVMAAALRE